MALHVCIVIPRDWRASLWAQQATEGTGSKTHTCYARLWLVNNIFRSMPALTCETVTQQIWHKYYQSIYICNWKVHSIITQLMHTLCTQVTRVKAHHNVKSVLYLIWQSRVKQKICKQSVQFNAWSLSVRCIQTLTSKSWKHILTILDDKTSIYLNLLQTKK